MTISHLDFHLSDVVQNGFSFLGQIDDVIAKDDPRNVTGRVTLYKVIALLQDPCMSFVLPQAIPAKGQFGGMGMEFELPYKKGQTVILRALEGDPRRIFIDGAYLNMDLEDGDDDTQVAQESADHPRVRLLINGVQITISKDGAMELQTPNEKSVTWKDADGRIYFKINWNGTEGRYNIKLGDETGIQKLLNEAAAAIYNSHEHTVVIPAPCQAAGTYTVLATSDTMGVNEMTKLTQAK